MHIRVYMHVCNYVNTFIHIVHSRESAFVFIVCWLPVSCDSLWLFNKTRDYCFSMLLVCKKVKIKIGSRVSTEGFCFCATVKWNYCKLQPPENQVHMHININTVIHDSMYA